MGLGLHISSCGHLDLLRSDWTRTYKVSTKENVMSEGQKRKDIFDRRPFGIPKRYILCAAWFLATIVTWFVTNDTHKTMLVAISTPFFAVFGMIFLSSIAMFCFAILLYLNEFLNSIMPSKYRRLKWYILIPLWVAIPMYHLIARGSVQGALLSFVLVPILVFMLLWFLGIFGSWIVAACEVKNPILKILAIIGVLVIIGVLIAIGINGGVSDDYDQYDRNDPTYFR